MPIKPMLGGRYQLIACLHSSDRETIYLAKDTQLRHCPQCVIRRFQLTESSLRASRFMALRLKKKAQALYQLSTCAALPTLLACFEDASNVYIVEEFIPGLPLSQLIGSGQMLSVPAAVDMMRGVLQGLVTIHQWGFVHGQIRPANIIQHQADSRLVLTGFGGFNDITAENQGGDSLPRLEDRLYKAPDEHLWPRFGRDIYAVGILAIQGVSGMTAHELSRRLATDKGVGPQRHALPAWQTCVTLPLPLVAILQRMIHTDMAYRYESATEVLDDLRAVGRSGADHSALNHNAPNRNAPNHNATSCDGGTPLSNGDRSRRGSPPAPARVWGQLWSFPPWKRVGVLGTALAICAALLALLLSRVPQRMLSQYFLHYAHRTAQQGDLKAAIALSSRALNYSDHNGIAYLRRGIAHYQLKAWNAAQADFTRAIAINERNGQAFYHRGLSRNRLGDHQGALLDYTQALALGTNMAQAYLRRGDIRAALGDAPGAIADYTLSIQKQPDLAVPYSRRCLAYLDIAQPGKALQDCGQAINLNPGGTEAYQNRSLVRQQLGDIEGAIADLTIVLRLDPENIEVYRQRQALLSNGGG